MKRILGISIGILCLWCLLFVGVTPQDSLAASPTMTTSIDTIDAWQAVTAGTLVDGAGDSISDSYATMLYIELAPIEAVATDGAEVIVEISYADDLWVELVKFKATAETAGADDLDEGGGATAGDAAITLTDATTDDFDVVGRRWLIWDTGAVANSEVVRTDVLAGNVVTLAQDLLNNHDDAEPVYDRVDQWVVRIPFGAAYVRTLINNVDADCDCAFTTRISKVTAAPG